mmetsp:Transcript_18859/g.24269  ORF Transcript_18859/g.24269 Transcript_18859/m.24269 type:complete len:146 (+) Transcript_18859:187-624(+)|eukprot:CAMPEP_0198139376 /NCGR_PEP_ID=MMETSP1443-20131203/2691_1 /TAXON_ID=186043 /ORGANISM="Entomoneis sp., Strain CCMP2396" /LENGTH=145 /DNA_ID=CAMNT_0043801489 /DNA_START=168 /DNA_END=605 /DNA_ORIENTATION=-
MSVNEVREPKAKEAFVVRGTGPPNSRTFCLGDEDHTIGNALRHVLIQNERISFAGYSVPHPSEPVVQIRVQTLALNKGEEPAPAMELLKESCQTLHDQCDFVLEKLESLLPDVRTDRLENERRVLEFVAEAEDMEEADEEDAMEE